MRLRICPHGLALAAALAAFVAGCGSFEHGSVRGKVVDARDGTPIQGVVVGIGSENATTAADGAYNIMGIRTGRKQVLVTKAGWYLPGDGVFVNVIEGVIDAPDIGILPTGEAPPDQPNL